MISTKRLYFDDPRPLPFTATVVGHGTWNGRPSLVLDRSGFYPEAGGQMADRGLLGGTAVIDVQVDESQVVHHLLAPEAALPAVGAEVEGQPDVRRRRLHQALHTGQHMLSRALIEVAGAETASSRLGETACTIDTPDERLREADLDRAAQMVNDLIDADLAVRAFFPDAETLAALPLRRRPKVSENVRVVQIGDFDCSPCGGTHCTGSAQVGLLRLDGVERYKGGQRVTFSAGARARAALFASQDLLAGLARGFTCGPSDVGAAVERLRRELTSAREAAGQLQARLVDQLAARLLAEAGPEPRFVLELPGEDPALARSLLRRLTAPDGAVALVAVSGPEGTQLLAGRGPGAAFDCGAFIKAACARGGGRGGGRSEGAEGRLPGPLPSPWAALVAELSGR